MQKKKNIIVITVSVLFLFGIIGGISAYNWNRYSNKKHLLRKYTTENNKELYILGTIGKKHFNKVNNYSMNDMLNVIENINPDLAMVQARESHFIRYGIFDGDIDACVSYCFCDEKQIPTKFINWWIVDNIYPEQSTTNLQDDNIFLKISRNVKNAEPGARLLVIINSHNFYEITNRLEVAGYKRTPINNKSDYFKGDGEKFQFPAIVAMTWRDRTYYYAYLFPEELKLWKDLSEEKKKKYADANHDKFYLREVKYCKYLNNDILYK